MRRASGAAGFPPVLFFAMATVDQARDFFADRWPDARVVADAEQRFYRAFGRERGSFGALMGLKTFGAGLRAMRKGHGVGRPVGDVRVMPGMFLVRDGHIVWEHRFDHSGDHPDLGSIAAIAAG